MHFHKAMKEQRGSPEHMTRQQEEASMVRCSVMLEASWIKMYVISAHRCTIGPTFVRLRYVCGASFEINDRSGALDLDSGKSTDS